MTTVHAYAWNWYNADGDEGLLTVFPTGGGISKTLRVFFAAATSLTPAEYAAQIISRAGTFEANGQRVALRLFQELWNPEDNRFLYVNEDDFDDEENWYLLDGIGPYIVPEIPAVTTTYLGSFLTAWRAAPISARLAYLVNEEEQEIGHDGVRGQANKLAFFASVTDDPESPYFGVPNLGNPASSPEAAQFRLDYNAWGYEEKATILRTMFGGFWSASPVAAESGLAWSNYKDRPEGRVSDRNAPPMYILPDASATVPSGLTEQAETNLRRWRMFVSRINDLRAYAVSGFLDPWVGPPGFGVGLDENGNGTWASATVLPFEKILFRMVCEHLHATGSDTHILWNAEPDPNRAENCVFLDAYYAQQHESGPVVRTLPQLDDDATTVRTTGNGRVVKTTFAEVFGMTTMFVRRGASQAVPYLQGWPWSSSDPLIVSAGVAGGQEIADMKAAIEATYGTSITVKDVTDRSMSKFVRSPVLGIKGWFR